MMKSQVYCFFETQCIVNMAVIELGSGTDRQTERQRSRQQLCLMFPHFGALMRVFYN